MLIRKEIEEYEKKHLSKFATLSTNSKGRAHKERLCDVRTIFMQDRDRIIHSTYFRRLKHKTQVFLAPTNDLFRTRLTHTLEVSQIARTIARALHLNEDLTEAIALGHDLGHTPFGHTGEEVLNEVYRGGFAHAKQSLRVVDILEKKGGMNLSFEVREGIVKHSKGGKKLLPYGEKDCPSTLEGEVVRVSDSIAYINHDIDDAVTSGIIKYSEFPKSSIKILGRRHSTRISTMVIDVIKNSIDKPHIFMSDVILEETEKLRSFLFSYVYVHPTIEKEAKKSAKLLKDLYFYFLDNPEIPLKALKKVEPENTKIDRIVVDFLSTLTDIEAIELYKQIFEPRIMAIKLK